MTVVQAITLDYLIAIYPLVLLLITFTLVSLHSRNGKIIIAIWKPLNMVMRPFFRNLNIVAKCPGIWALVPVVSQFR